MGGDSIETRNRARLRIRDDWRGAFKGAFRKGWEAERCGKPIEDCPYEPKPGPYAAAERFGDAWKDGWNTARQERNHVA